MTRGLGCGSSCTTKSGSDMHAPVSASFISKGSVGSSRILFIFIIYKETFLDQSIQKNNLILKTEALAPVHDALLIATYISPVESLGSSGFGTATHGTSCDASCYAEQIRCL